MDDVTRENQELWRRILSEGILDRELFSRIVSAVNYDAASSIGWAQHTLEQFRERLKSGQSIRVYHRENDQLKEISQIQDFDQWLQAHFGQALN